MTDPSVGSTIEKANASVSITHVPRSVRMHSLSYEEIEGLIGLGSALHLSLAGMAFGAFVSFLVVVTTTPPQEPKIFATFVSLTVLFCVLTVSFGCLATRDILAQRRRLKQFQEPQNP